MRALLDMDNVLVDWSASYDAVLEEIDPKRIVPRAGRRGQQDWNLKAGLGDEACALIDQAMSHPDLYRNPPMMPGVKDALALLRLAGAEVFIVSTPDLTNPTCASQKLAWVTRNFGLAQARRTILTADKTAVSGDILVDDKPVITGAADPSWERIIFGAYRYNIDRKGRRIRAWNAQNVKYLVDRMEAR